MERVVAVTVLVLASTHVSRTLPHSDRSVIASDRSGAAVDHTSDSVERYGLLPTSNIAPPIVTGAYITPVIYPRPDDLDPRFILKPNSGLEEWPRHRRRKPNLSHDDDLWTKYGHKKHLVEIVPIRHKSKTKALAYILPKLNNKKLSNRKRVSGIVVNRIPDIKDIVFESEENSIESNERGLSDSSDSSESRSSENTSSILKYRPAEQKHENNGDNDLDFETNDSINDIDIRGLIPDKLNSEYHVHYITHKKHHKQFPTASNEEHHHSSHLEPPSLVHHIHNEPVNGPTFHHVHKKIAEISELDNQDVHTIIEGSNNVNGYVNMLPLNGGISAHNNQLVPKIIIGDSSDHVHQHVNKIFGGNSEHVQQIILPVHKKIENGNEYEDFFRPSHNEIFGYNVEPHLYGHHPHHREHDDMYAVQESGPKPLSIGEQLDTSHVKMTENKDGIAEAVSTIQDKHLHPKMIYINDAINEPHSNLDNEIKVFYHVDSPDIHHVHVHAEAGIQRISDTEENLSDSDSGDASDNHLTSDSISSNSKLGNKDSENSVSDSVEPNVESLESASSLDSLDDSSNSESMEYDSNEPINEESAGIDDSSSSRTRRDDIYRYDLGVSTEEIASSEQSEEHHDISDKHNSADASDGTVGYDVIVHDCNKTNHKAKCDDNCKHKSYKLTFLFNK